MGLSWGWMRGFFSTLRQVRRSARLSRTTQLEDRTLLTAFVVNTTLDTVDATPGDGLALDANGNTSLRAAVMEANALAGADTITLGAGSYQFSLTGTGETQFSPQAGFGDIDVLSAITIEGAGAAQTTIDANLLDRAFDVGYGASLTLRGVTVTRGQTDDGGAIRNRGVLTIENSVLTGNRATRRGGAIEVLDDTSLPLSATLTNVTLSNNVASNVGFGGGITTAVNGLGGAMYIESADLTLNNTALTGNTAAGDGGAIYSFMGSATVGMVTLNNSALASNSAVNGGAIRFIGPGRMTINDSLFSGNSAQFSGGAIRATGGGTLNINRGDFENNQTTYFTDWNASLNGGALSLNSNTTINGTEFRNNSSWRGGAIYAFSTGVTVLNSLFEGNNAFKVLTPTPDTSGRGGAIMVDTNAVVTSVNNTLVGNRSSGAGAIYVGSTTRIVNNTITGNISDGGEFGGDAAVDGTGSLFLANSIIAGNSGVYETSTPDISRRGVASGGGNLIGNYVFSPTSVGYHITDLFGTLTTLLDPQLLPLAENGGPTRTMAIAATSLARDLGLVTNFVQSTDARGMSRSGPKPDAGAYEYQNRPVSALPYTGQTNEDTSLSASVQATDADGDTITYEFFPLPPAYGTLVGNANGQFTYRPAPNFNGRVLFYFRATDGHGSTSNWIENVITVTPVNDPPVIPDQTFIIDEGLNVGGYVGNVIWQDDGPFPIWWTFSSGNEDLRLLFQGGGSTIIIGKPEAFDFETQPVQNFVLKVWDADGLTTYANYTIILRDVTIPKVAYNYFSVQEHLPNGTVLTTLQLNSIPDAGQSVVYSIDQDPTGGAFTIDPVTGVITVANSQLLNYETNTQLQYLKIRTTDASNPSLTTVGDVGFTLIDINEAPVMTNQSFSVDENTANNVVVGQVIATDEDLGQVLTYAIIDSTLPGAFAINPSTGAIRVNDASLLNYEQVSTVTMTVTVRDNGNPSFTTTREVVISINDQNEAPIVADQSFTVSELPNPGQVLGFIAATEVDVAQTLEFELVSTDLPGAFQIEPDSGAIRVLDRTLLDYETLPVITLVVRVSDSGSPSLSSIATMTIHLTDVNDAPVIVESNFSVNENSANGTLVGKVIAYDPDAGQTLTYSIDSSDRPGAFAINSVTGELTVANASLLNYEAVQQIHLRVFVVDNGTPIQGAFTDITVNIRDANERPVIVSQNFTVAENSANGTVVGTVVASDVDAGQSLTYAIAASVPVSGAFAINAATGQITVANRSLLNFETLSAVTLTVTVTDSGSPDLSASANIVVNLSDVNDAPVLANYNFTIAENSLDTNRVGFVTGSDEDAGQSLTYAISASTLPGAFGIDPTTGEVTVTNSSLLNFEAITRVTLTVTSTDDANPALTSAGTVTISITDVNERPVIHDQYFTVAENSANGTVVGSVVASDVDAGQSLTYAISASAPVSGAFAINAATGEISVADSSLLDYESISAVALTVTVTDNGSPALSSSAVVVVTLTDANDAPTVQNFSFTVAENTLNTNRVGFVTGSDFDAGQSLTYAITSSSLPGAFDINPTTGEVTVTNSSLLNFEAVTSVTLTVTATDNGSPALSGSGTVTIAITDVNERPTIVGQNFTVAENSANGTVVGTVVASDVDAGQSLTYAISASAPVSGAFAINAATGQITVANGSLLNFESISAVALTITVTDNGNPAMSSSAVVVVTLTDVNEAPTITNQAFSIAENSANGTAVGTITASDVDAGQSLTYAITTSTLAGAFTINAATGAITVLNGDLLNYETVTSATLTVRVTDSGNPVLSSTATVTISITNVNETPTISNQTFSIAENSANGTIVGNLVASDVDAGQSLTYSIVSGNTSGAFAINATTGRVTVANVAALDYETTPVFSLVVRATDNGTPSLSSTATVTINLTDVIEAVILGLDVVPGDPSNTIKLSGKFDVAIFSTATFDARTVNVSTIRFGKNGTEDSITRDKKGNLVYSYSDVNGDGRLDLVINITANKTGLVLGDTLAKVSGLTNSGLQILGSSAVIVRR